MNNLASRHGATLEQAVAFPHLNVVICAVVKVEVTVASVLGCPLSCASKHTKRSVSEQVVYE